MKNVLARSMGWAKQPRKSPFSVGRSQGRGSALGDGDDEVDFEDDAHAKNAYDSGAFSIKEHELNNNHVVKLEAPPRSLPSQKSKQQLSQKPPMESPPSPDSPQQSVASRQSTASRRSRKLVSQKSVKKRYPKRAPRVINVDGDDDDDEGDGASLMLSSHHDDDDMMGQQDRPHSEDDWSAYDTKSKSSPTGRSKRNMRKKKSGETSNGSPTAGTPNGGVSGAAKKRAHNHDGNEEDSHGDQDQDHDASFAPPGRNLSESSEMTQKTGTSSTVARERRRDTRPNKTHREEYDDDDDENEQENGYGRQGIKNEFQPPQFSFASQNEKEELDLAIPQTRKNQLDSDEVSVRSQKSVSKRILGNIVSAFTQSSQLPQPSDDAPIKSKTAKKGATKSDRPKGNRSADDDVASNQEAQSSPQNKIKKGKLLPSTVANSISFSIAAPTKAAVGEGSQRNLVPTENGKKASKRPGARRMSGSGSSVASNKEYWLAGVTNKSDREKQQRRASLNESSNLGVTSYDISSRRNDSAGAARQALATSVVKPLEQNTTGKGIVGGNSTKVLQNKVKGSNQIPQIPTSIETNGNSNGIIGGLDCPGYLKPGRHQSQPSSGGNGVSEVDGHAVAVGSFEKDFSISKFALQKANSARSLPADTGEKGGAKKGAKKLAPSNKEKRQSTFNEASTNIIKTKDRPSKASPTRSKAKAGLSKIAKAAASAPAAPFADSFNPQAPSARGNRRRLSHSSSGGAMHDEAEGAPTALRRSHSMQHVSSGDAAAATCLTATSGGKSRLGPRRLRANSMCWHGPAMPPPNKENFKTEAFDPSPSLFREPGDGRNAKTSYGGADAWKGNTSNTPLAHQASATSFNTGTTESSMASITPTSPAAQKRKVGKANTRKDGQKSAAQSRPAMGGDVDTDSKYVVSTLTRIKKRLSTPANRDPPSNTLQW